MDYENKILQKYNLCNRCYGRIYAKLMRMGNKDRGTSIKTVIAMNFEEKLKDLIEEKNNLIDIISNSQDINENEEIDENTKNNEDTENKADDKSQSNEEKIQEIDEKINIIKENLTLLRKTGLNGIKNEYIIEELLKDDITREENESEENESNIFLTPEQKCPWCKDVFNIQNLEEIADKIVEALSEYEFDRFLIGTRLPKRIKELEKDLETTFNEKNTESLRNEFGRELGKILTKKLEKPVDKETPDIVVMVNPYNQKIYLQINPIFIKGRYRKTKRGIPQSHWDCRSCRGKGCEKCNFTGKQYPTSVEEIIAEPVMNIAKGSGEALHAAGREDIDVKMLGKGRPFVIEVKEPKVRKMDLLKIMDEINKIEGVEVSDLEYGVKNDVRFFKNEPHTKTYCALVSIVDEELENHDFENDKIVELSEKLENLRIDQRTPHRVSHRRADLVRVRNIYKAWCEPIDEKSFKLTVYCDGGLYIKELISGDEGRTKPSISEILDIPCYCKLLTVMEVHDENNPANY
ncbi:tRNA pseudouridine(54/55) synthase Pus10 [Methanococcus voltae]|uniref:tRNA pseudouridine synthase Pus10 n=1 Tax=Methanococcus voltae (strain ATCC BAA-1334 / A3) TaxID=456320 RepID=PUS10_METV3|nr:tRNA pseudouridine(54/55) synthase Pus10 [Methanococcus voltae]D7DQH5.1 RecName: Full=tRNA pseudouridine synthase Pus10; AltName: Full=tRNA pseudouridine 54/55 synthase; Short=Psi54/55 synthase [Methanococcus voltae A3]MCS3901663.1 tRNA pseudouridine synthase 10 [Methanococcus voltae]